MTRDTERGTILVVDDNLGIRVFTKMLLGIAGYAVVTATDGEEALQLYEQHHSHIVLLVTDVAMPNMNGFELVERVLQINPDLPVLFMSGRYGGIVFRGLESLTKPFRPAELVDRVNQALNVGGRSDSPITDSFPIPLAIPTPTKENHTHE